MRNSHDLEDRFITRVVGAQVAAWRVEIKRGGHKITSVYFTDVEYHGTEAAHAAAVEFRDLIVKKFNVKLKEYDGNGYYESNSKNWTGMVGVSLVKIGSSRYVRYAWASRVMRDGKQVNRSWSIKKYGYSNAFYLAAANRAKYTGQQIALAPTAPSYLVQWATENEIELI